MEGGPGLVGEFGMSCVSGGRWTVSRFGGRFAAALSRETKQQKKKRRVRYTMK